MIKLKILILISVMMLFISCGDNPAGSSGGDKFEGVPKGEIVPVELRDETLTGISNSSSKRKAANSQKWWRQVVSKIDYTGCEGYEDEEITAENMYFGFKPEGSLYVKDGENGSESYATSWQWSDESKSAIVLGMAPDVEFELTALNDEEVVYASSQEFEGGCRAVTWEQFGDPVQE